MAHDIFAQTLAKIEDTKARIAVIGLGYVGLPLAAAAARAGYDVRGFDVDPEKIEALNNGDSYIDAVTSEELKSHVAAKRFEASAQFAGLTDCDAIIICVPTPLTKTRDPDLRFVENTAQTIGSHLRAGQLVVLESTTYPGTTKEVLEPILEKSGLTSGRDFWVGFSPEREDPGNKGFETANIPKIVSGEGEQALQLVQNLYAKIVSEVVPVSSTAVAEAVKITENVFRSVNIALVNELKVIYDKMGIDVWEVIDAAATKPFGYMPFYPGPGLGGHCIPIDPFYLSWKAREFGQTAHFIELAGEINIAMPAYVISRMEEALDRNLGVSLGKAKILIVGLAYKKDVADIRESPALVLMDMLEARGSDVEFHDPHVDVIPQTREHANLAGRASSSLDGKSIGKYDCVLIATDHTNIDYDAIAREAKMVVDTRNALGRRGIQCAVLIKA